MTKPASPAPISPLAFTLAYQQYRSEASRTPFVDARILKAAQFWDTNAAALDNPKYSTYHLEDIPPLLAALNLDHLDDLRPTELEKVAEFIERVGMIVSPPPSKDPPPIDSEQTTASIPSVLARIWGHAAKQWLYLGEPSRAVAALLRGGHPFSVEPDELTSILVDCDGCDATEVPGILASRVESSNPTSARWLRDFDAEWTAQRENGDANRALCLLVEYDANGSPVRGRLRRLEGRVEILKRDADSDEVIFHHQVKSPDDPFVGTVYAAFEVLRHLISSKRSIRGSDDFHSDRGTPSHHPGERSDEGSAIRPRPKGRQWRLTAGPHYRGRFTFNRDGGETYSGDSIGLSALAVTYGDQWGHEVHRERRLIGQTVAFTGGIGPDGSIQPVLLDSLPLKVERAFHSPITHLVVPDANRKAVEAEAERLRQVHPRRRLHIIGIERPTDIIADQNIMRPEKLCPGEFAIRKAAKYSRSVKVQVPALMVMGYLLLCLIYPPLWLFFDSNPVRLEVSARGVKALNQSGQTIGGFYSFPKPLLPSAYDENRDKNDVRYYLIDDLDGDGQSEVVFCPYYEGTGPDLQGPVYVFSMHRLHDLDTLFTIPLFVATAYEGDSASAIGATYRYFLQRLLAIAEDKRPTRLLALITVNSEPARAQVAVYDYMGKRRGLYLNQGHFSVSACAAIDVDGDGKKELCLGGANNRLDAPILAILDYGALSGVSPPWDSPQFLQSGMAKGNQREYYAFGKTVSTVGRTLMSSIRRFQWDRSRGLLVTIEDDSGWSYHCQLGLSLAPRHVLFDDGNIDRWTARFGHPPDQAVYDSLLTLVRIWRDTVPILPSVR